MEGWSTPDRRSKYPWSEWTDGTYRLAFRDRDFEVSVMHFRVGLHGRAQKQGLRVGTKTIPAHTPMFANVTEGILFRFLRPGDEKFSLEAGLLALVDELDPAFVEQNPSYLTQLRETVLR